MTERPSHKVLVLSFEYPPQAGAGTHVHELVMGLAGIGCDVTLLAPTTGQAKTYRESGVEVHLMSPSRETCEKVARLSNVQGVLALQDDLAAAGERLINEQVQRPAVIHFHDWYTYGVARELKRKFEIPIVGTAHSISLPIVKWWGESPDEEVVREERRMYHEVDALITVSASMGRLMREAYEISGVRLHVVHNGVDFRRFVIPELEPEKIRCLRQTIAAPQDKIVIFAGRLTPQKGIEAIFDAANQVSKEYPNVCYILAGEPDSRNSSHSIESLTERYAELKKKIRRLGKVPRYQLAMLYRAADIALIPSIYEPFGYAALEAMASGVPVIATDVGGLAEIITHKQTGWLVPLSADGQPSRSVDVEALAIAQLTLLRDEEEARRLGEAGRCRALQDFGIEKMVQSTLQVYQRAIATFSPVGRPRRRAAATNLPWEF